MRVAAVTAFMPDFPGCITAGQSREETHRLIRKAIAFHIEDLKQDGQPVPKPH